MKESSLMCAQGNMSKTYFFDDRNYALTVTWDPENFIITLSLSGKDKDEISCSISKEHQYKEYWCFSQILDVLLKSESYDQLASYINMIRNNDMEKFNVKISEYDDIPDYFTLYTINVFRHTTKSENNVINKYYHIIHEEGEGPNGHYHCMKLVDVANAYKCIEMHCNYGLVDTSVYLPEELLLIMASRCIDEQEIADTYQLVKIDTLVKKYRT